MNDQSRIEPVFNVTRELAHVIQADNLFVDRIRKIADHQFETEFTVDGLHPYLYENEAISNHVSGTSFLEVTRQICKALSHLYYDVPINSRFALKNVNMEFLRWAKCGVPVYTHLSVVSKGSALGAWQSSSFNVTLAFAQEGRDLGMIKFSFAAMTKELEDRLMSRQYNKPPVIENMKSVPPHVVMK